MSTLGRPDLQPSWGVLGPAEQSLFECKYHALVSQGNSPADAVQLVAEQRFVWVSELQRSVLCVIADARTHPEVCIRRLQQKIGYLKGKEFHDPLQPGLVKVTKEGRVAIDDAVDALVSVGQQDCPECFMNEPVQALSLSAEDHCLDIGPRGVVSHEGSDGSSAAERMSRYCNWAGACSECIWYGVLNVNLATLELAERIVDDLIIDDGVSSRGHRAAMLDKKYLCAGVSFCAHATFGHVVVIDFAADCADDDEKQDNMRRRISAGGPKYTLCSTSNEDSFVTQWKNLGHCAGCSQNVHGGRVVETENTESSTSKLVWHEVCFRCCHCQTSLRGSEYKCIRAPDSAGGILNKNGSLRSSSSHRLACLNCWGVHEAPLCESCGQRISDGKTVKWRNRVFDITCYEIEMEKMKLRNTSEDAVSLLASSRASAHNTGKVKKLREEQCNIKAKKINGKKSPASLGQAQRELKTVINDYGDLL